MKHFWLILLFSFSIIFYSCGYKDDFFVIGQVWNYKTRPTESNSTLTIVSVEKNKEKGVIVGVYIDNLNIPSLGNGAVIHFLPISKEALKNSLAGMKDNIESLPDYKESYREWKNKFDLKQCEFYKYPVSQVIDTIQKALEKR